MTKQSMDLDTFELLLKEMLEEIHRLSGCQSVAIRLHKDGDFPYFLHMGFPEFFILKEDSLTKRDRRNKPVLDADGTPFVECMCGNVIKGRFSPKRPYFTSSGAFWTNSTTRLLESLTEKERIEIGKTRNTCHEHGYESVALIPVHADGKTIGLIQINDPRENMFTSRKIDKYQLLADNVGAILYNFLEFREKAVGVSSPISSLKSVAK